MQIILDNKNLIQFCTFIPGKEVLGKKGIVFIVCYLLQLLVLYKGGKQVILVHCHPHTTIFSAFL